ncbi:MAG: toll/interleukin-1 receptor domain-containing protein [Actinomycetota bacterium]|nr:toll/interleukin-1 receptor domain-containing protein [Actinomycetota bacterium]
MRDGVRVSVALTLVDDSGKRLESEPENIGIGVLQLRRWPIHRVGLERDLFKGSSAVLVKVNYELELEPDFPAMSWFEVGFHFEDDIATTVLDALPHGSNSPQPARSHALNRYAQFVPAEAGDNTPVYLPAVEERVDLHGIGGSSVRWRHSTRDPSGVRAGSRSAWLLLLASEGRVRQRCQLVVRYDLSLDEDTPYRPTQQPTTFDITLDDVAPGTAIEPSSIAHVRAVTITDNPSVFICYAHESPKFKAEAKKLANVLMNGGLEVHMDQFDVGPKKNWRHWSLEHFRNRDFTIVLASPTFRKIGDGQYDGDDHAGLRSELTALETLYSRYPKWTRYVLPVILPGQSKHGIPIFLGPENEDFYEVDDFTPKGVANLMSAIRGTERRTWPLD